jgi:outer membrane protein assembly factor BamB
MEFGEVFSGVARDGVLYVGVTNDATDASEVWAVGGATGEAAWTASIGSDYPNPILADDGTVVVSADDAIVGLDGASGAERWRFERAVGVYFSFSENQAVGDMVIVHDVEEAAVLALDVRSGSVLWEEPDAVLLAVFDDWALLWRDEGGGEAQAVSLDDGRRLWSQPYVGLDWELHVPVLEAGVVFVGDRESVRAMDARSGDEVWTTELSDCCVGATVLEADTLYVAFDETSVAALDRRSGAVRWVTDTGLDLDLYRTEGMPLAALGEVLVVGGAEEEEIIGLYADTGTTVWRLSTDADYFSPFISSGGTIYVADADGVGYAVDAADGSVLWSAGTDEDLEISYLRPVLDSGLLYLFGWAGVAAIR